MNQISDADHKGLFTLKIVGKMQKNASVSIGCKYFKNAANDSIII